MAHTQQRHDFGRGRCPPWLEPLLRRRTHLAHTALQIVKGDQSIVWLYFLVLMLKPFTAVCRRLLPISASEAMTDRIVALAVAPAAYVRNFKVQPGFIHDDSQLCDLEEGDEIFVLPNVSTYL